MRKRWITVPLATLLTAGLVGCNGDNEGAYQDRYTDMTQPVGYYSDENVKKGGNVNVQDDNDGPLTEMMDNMAGYDNNNNRAANIDENGYPPNPTVPRASYDKNFFERDNRFSHSDANYHGHLDDNTREARNSYYTAFEGDLSEKISNVTASVDNVEDVRSVAYGSDILIAVDLTNYTIQEETKARIRSAVQPYTKGRSVTVVTDEGTFSRIRNIDNDMRDGGPRETIDVELDNIFNGFRERGMIND